MGSPGLSTWEYNDRIFQHTASLHSGTPLTRQSRIVAQTGPLGTLQTIAT